MRAFFLKTDRLGFSTWQTTDINLANSLWGEPAVTKFISANGLFSKEQVHDRLNKEIKSDQQYNVQYWPLFELKTNKHIGCCGLHPYDLDKKTYEIGFHLKSAYWGNGYATEAATAVIRYAFDQLKSKNLFAGHNPKNVASKNLLLKLGFKYSHDEFYEPTGLNHPSYFYK
ncbi:N-acetyltransferase [Sporolactobacillus shoreae]|uniref:N-acetyltransferase n=1 Tax=Sporolactobacillus shoreae TaxID=1465501 RepID=A0A4Z0GJI7_9BACL|nr:GNAT family N-acetyltransferase [Sporolactobacillus shoreae]TGA96943.1 N-acetyltransferase [Sporolactobacillus shoreae]